MSTTAGNMTERGNGAVAGANATPASSGHHSIGAAPHASPAAAAQTLAPAKDVRPDAGETSRAFNRDLSWLEFNRRVLHQAIEKRTPLLERVRFLGIFSSNLDEFIMKRIGALKSRLADASGLAAAQSPDQDGLPAGVLLSALRKTIRELQTFQTTIFETEVKPALAREEIALVDYAELSEPERKWANNWHRHNVFPVLTPLSVDPGHRFPFISNLSRNFGVLLAEPGRFEPLFARVKVPSVLSQWIQIPPIAALEQSGVDASNSGIVPAGRGKFVNLRDIIRHNLDDLFPGMQIVEVVAFRVTRDSETEAGDDDADNLLELVEAQLRRRRFADTVRLEIGPNPSSTVLSHLADEL
ncbi:MAG: hypothetical protein H7210_04420, partial [Pyrinomonadaceae bacterium]|nr:hypothetical protein [Phycisphaerales bacterium]